MFKVLNSVLYKQIESASLIIYYKSCLGIKNMGDIMGGIVISFFPLVYYKQNKQTTLLHTKYIYDYIKVFSHR